MLFVLALASLTSLPSRVLGQSRYYMLGRPIQASFLSPMANSTHSAINAPIPVAVRAVDYDYVKYRRAAGTESFNGFEREDPANLVVPTTAWKVEGFVNGAWTGGIDQGSITATGDTTAEFWPPSLGVDEDSRQMRITAIVKDKTTSPQRRDPDVTQSVTFTIAKRPTISNITVQVLDQNNIALPARLIASGALTSQTVRFRFRIAGVRCPMGWNADYSTTI